MHIELAPPTDEPPEGELKNGSVIPLSAASTYPTTEQTLASVSILLNGGGLGQLQEINQTFAKALAGRENDMRSLLTQLDVFIKQLNEQTDDIIAATENLNALVGQVAAKDDDRRQGADDHSAGDLGAGGFAREAGGRHRRARQVQRHRHLDGQSDQGVAGGQPAQHRAGAAVELANAGPALTKGLDFLSTYPWVKSTVPNWFRGDFANITLVIDLTLSRMDAGLFTGTRWEGDLTELELQWGRTIGQKPSPYTAGNPLIAPYRLGGLLTCCVCPARCGSSWRSWRPSR